MNNTGAYQQIGGLRDYQTQNNPIPLQVGPKSEVQNANDNVNDSVNLLDKLIEELHVKLKSVIRPMPKQPEQGDKPTAQYTTQLANQINVHTIYLNRLATKLQDLLQNIEL